MHSLAMSDRNKFKTNVLYMLTRSNGTKKGQDKDTLDYQRKMK